MVKHVASFSDSLPAPEYDYPAPERQLKGNPKRTSWTVYRSQAEEFECGIWECEAGAWRAIFHESKEEYFHVLQGRVRMTAEDGTAREFGPRGACVIPAGFIGSFEALEPVRKHYVIYEKG